MLACGGSDKDNPFGNSGANTLGTPTSAGGSETSDSSVETGSEDSSSSGSGPGSGEVSSSSSGAATTVDPTEGATTSACMGAPTGDTAFGEDCTDGCECASGVCYAIPLVLSTCSSCLSDVECQVDGVGTCSPDPITQGASCTAGELGVWCEPEAMGCAPGLQCVQLIDTVGLLPDDFCSECATSDDCQPTEVCAPQIQIDGVQTRGFLECVAAGTNPDGAFCPADGDATVCASGACSVVDIADLGIADIGVCGPCAVDADCPMGTCQPAVVDGDGAVPSMCV